MMTHAFLLLPFVAGLLIVPSPAQARGAKRAERSSSKPADVGASQRRSKTRVKFELLPSPSRELRFESLPERKQDPRFESLPARKQDPRFESLPARKQELRFESLPSAKRDPRFKRLPRARRAARFELLPKRDTRAKFELLDPRKAEKGESRSKKASTWRSASRDDLNVNVVVNVGEHAAANRASANRVLSELEALRSEIRALKRMMHRLESRMARRRSRR